jgi:hypothetical protein
MSRVCASPPVPVPALTRTRNPCGFENPRHALPLPVCGLLFASILQLFNSCSCSATSTALSREPGSPTASQNPPNPSSSQFSFPIQSVYQSARTLPALPSNPPSSSQPFLSFRLSQHPLCQLKMQTRLVLHQLQRLFLASSRSLAEAVVAEAQLGPPLPSPTSQSGQRSRTVFWKLIQR